MIGIVRQEPVGSIVEEGELFELREGCHEDIGSFLLELTEFFKIGKDSFVR